jgi:hypothetical protein
VTDLADASDKDRNGVLKMAENRPGNGMWGWLGRQFGYVKKAVKADVTKQIVHRQQKVEEAKLPEQPNVTLRRTVIDEVIVDKRLPAPPPPPQQQRQENQQ